jgi:hypothetical protein
MPAETIQARWWKHPLPDILNSLIEWIGITMTPKLADDLRQAIEEHGGAPVYIVDPSTNESYVIVRASQYEKLKSLFEQEGDFDPREAYPFVDAAMRADDAADPTLETYQQFPRPKP